MGTFCCLRDNRCSPLGSFCSFVELYRNSMALQYTVIEVYRSLFKVKLRKRRHVAASPPIAEYIEQSRISRHHPRSREPNDRGGMRHLRGILLEKPPSTTCHSLRCTQQPPAVAHSVSEQKATYAKIKALLQV